MNGMKGAVLGAVFLSAILFSSCAAQSPQLYSTLWVQTAAEYRAGALETYASAVANLDDALADPSWTAALEQSDGYSGLPPAVILDLDETVLDNSLFQGRLVRDNASFDPVLWEKWMAMEKAEAIPGALSFVQEAIRRGIAVFYITNRECDGGGCPQEARTIRNLTRLGFPDVSLDRVLLKREQPDWGSEKENRRAVVAENHRILMLIGDDLGDFLPGVKGGVSPTRRKELVDRYADRWGRMWFILPNPNYGSWDRALSEPKADQVRGF